MKAFWATAVILSDFFLFADDVSINFTAPEAQIFFKTAQKQKTVLLQQVAFVTPETSFPKTYRNENQPLNEDLLAAALKENAKTVICSLADTSIAQVAKAKASGLKVGLSTARNGNDVIKGVLKKPDFIVIDPALPPDAVRTVLNKDFSDKVSKFCEPISLSQKGDWTLNYETAQKRSAGTNLRLLSFNILSCKWTEKPCVWARVERLGEILRAFAPDAAGLQEVDQAWYREAPDKIKPYIFANNGDHACQIVYHPERLQELEGGVFQITDGWIRCVNWVKFQDKKTGKVFIVGSTHWNLSEQKRVGDGRKMAEFANRMQAMHQCPVFFTGDYNCNVDEKGFLTLLADSGLKDSTETALSTENKNISSYYWPLYFTTPYQNVKHIDHITYADDFCVPLSARLILGAPALSMSDHLPLLVDYRWK